MSGAREEVWRPVVGWEGLYEVSSRGRVRSLDRLLVKHTCQGCGLKTYRTTKGRLRHQQLDFAGYPRVFLMAVGRKGKLRPVHQLVVEAFVGPRPEGFEVLHVDGVRTNNIADNLRWGTKAENAADRERHGRGYRGNGAGRAKLTEEQVLEIRRSKGKIQELALRYAVTSQCIRHVIKRKTWPQVA